MQVEYISLSLNRIYELVKSKPGRDDLFFEEKTAESPGVLRNLKEYRMSFTDINNYFWFQRKIKK